MGATDQLTEQVAQTTAQLESEPGHEPMLTLDLSLGQAEALRAWLLKPAEDGTTSLDDPFVSSVLAELGRSVDTVLATVNVRRELQQAGLSVDHLSDDQVRELGQRVADAASPGVRS